MRNGKSDEECLFDLAELFKVFGDTTRIRILYALHEQAKCVSELAEQLQLTQSAVSHQLSILKKAKLIKCCRNGKNRTYSLADSHVETILQMGMEHVNEQ